MLTDKIHRLSFTLCWEIDAWVFLQLDCSEFVQESKLELPETRPSSSRLLVSLYILIRREELHKQAACLTLNR